MSSENDFSLVKELEKKVETLTKELETHTEKLAALDKIHELSKKIDALANDLESIKTKVDDQTKLEEIAKSIEEKDVDGLSSKIDNLASNLDSLSSKLGEVEASVTTMRDSKETEVLFKKLDDILIAVTDLNSVVDESLSSSKSSLIDEKIESISKSTMDIASSVDQLRESSNTEVLGKKIDDLQHYVAGLSVLEEKVGEISSSYAETKEIVGIIVRQLDDIERKYNKALDEIGQAMESVRSLVEGRVMPVSETPKKSPKKPSTKEPKPKIDAATVDGLMNALLKKVKPQTEAKEMAKALEEVRDKLTTMIKTHSPVFHQFGTRARELKSYPPTATLNENDIARLNKDLRDWTAKLKKLAS